MVLGYHLILTAYGFWLPNDPRGSWSDFVGAWELFLAGGRATKVETRRSVAGREHDVEQRLMTKRFLKREPVVWDGRQALEITRGFQEVGFHWGLRFYACSVMPKHVHLVIGWTERDIELVMNQLKGRGSARLALRGMHPFQEVFEKDGKRATCWARRGWNVFLDSVGDMKRAIEYVERNPLKDGMAAQRWGFVEGYGG